MAYFFLQPASFSGKNPMALDLTCVSRNTTRKKTIMNSALYRNTKPSLFNMFFDDHATRSHYGSPNKPNSGRTCAAPATNIFETKNDYKLEIAAPGLDKKDFILEMTREENEIYNNDLSYPAEINQFDFEYEARLDEDYNIENESIFD